MHEQIASNSRSLPIRPSGQASLDDRQRYLRRQRRRLGDRGWLAAWVAAGALVSWLFIAGFAGMGH